MKNKTSDKEDDGDYGLYGDPAMSAEPGDYMVTRQGDLIVVYSENPPTSDIHSLLRGWDYSGYKWCASRVARRLGACLVVCRSIQDEERWLGTQASPGLPEIPGDGGS